MNKTNVNYQCHCKVNCRYAGMPNKVLKCRFADKPTCHNADINLSNALHK